MRKKVDDETKEIIVSFIAEGYERLDDAEVQLGKLAVAKDMAEGSPEDKGRLNSVFRLFHSVKGSAGYLGFESIKGLTHEAEALLEVFLKEKIAPTPESLDVIYTTVDVLRGLIKTVEGDYSDEAGAASAGARRLPPSRRVSPRSGPPCGPAPSRLPRRRLLRPRGRKTASS